MLQALLLLAAALLEACSGRRPSSGSTRKPLAPGSALDRQEGYWRNGRYVRPHYRHR